MKHKCPICKAETDSAVHADFPFCSARCRMQDLGNDEEDAAEGGRKAILLDLDKADDNES